MTETNSSKNFPVLIIVGRESDSVARYINEILDYEIKTSCHKACSASSQLYFNRLVSEIPCELISGIFFNDNECREDDQEILKIKKRCSNFKIRMVNLAEYKTYREKVEIIREVVSHKHIVHL
jgi:adenylate kinase family enzyme